MEAKDVLYIAGLILTTLAAYFGGRAQNRKTNIEGKILTAEKIDEFVSALVKAKFDMHEIAVQLKDCLNDQKKCGELRKRIIEINENFESNANDAAQILKSLKELIG